ncbi:hypothetical protein MIND_00885200 [Mycena indigotica]|uniref:Uncharacterized protein n=1 Tax=Mycena indigotica TaxID=2126181 RepID=A0A8H6SGV7_9AGAR|nr:uncharacterized protein MIND_00885200 [Mycena indigotica]KAF7299360.1 hypothetical protein MIND_00885200 [Mycena indigotica]
MSNVEARSRATPFESVVRMESKTSNMFYYRAEILPYNEKLILGYMRKNQPFASLPEEYYECSRKSQDPPGFIYGFPFRFDKNGDLDATAAKLYAMQDRIPVKELRDRTKYAPGKAITKYLQDSIDGDFPKYIGTDVVDSDDDVFQLFHIYGTFLARTPQKPRWVDAMADICTDIFHELGWEDVEAPKWYLELESRVYPDSKDYNIKYNAHDLYASVSP